MKAPDQFDEYFRCSHLFTTSEHAPEIWVFEVAVVTWDGKPYNPSLTWKPFRYWKTEPDDVRIARAKAAALKTPRFFKMCRYCKELNNAGHMCEPTVCQSCASEHLGVVY